MKKLALALAALLLLAGCGTQGTGLSSNSWACTVLSEEQYRALVRQVLDHDPRSRGPDADPVVIPPEAHRFYSERVVTLPDAKVITEAVVGIYMDTLSREGSMR